jgi:hypothetical protein
MSAPALSTHDEDGFGLRRDANRCRAEIGLPGFFETRIPIVVRRRIKAVQAGRQATATTRPT